MALALLIDDAYSNNNMLRLYLQRFNVDSVSALTGQRGYEIAQMIYPDIVFLDINMPVKSWNGYMTATEFKKHPDLQHIPIIAVSAFHEEEVARTAGIDEFLRRPYGAAQLKMLLLTYLGSAS